VKGIHLVSVPWLGEALWTPASLTSRDYLLSRVARAGARLHRFSRGAARSRTRTARARHCRQQPSAYLCDEAAGGAQRIAFSIVYVHELVSKIARSNAGCWEARGELIALIDDNERAEPTAVVNECIPRLMGCASLCIPGHGSLRHFCYQRSRRRDLAPAVPLAPGCRLASQDS
jgi:hypothetical protein